MARRDPGPGERRTGVVPGTPRHYRRVEGRPTTGFDWLVVGVLVVVAALSVGWLLAPRGGNAVGPGPSGSASPSPTLTPSAATATAPASRAGSTEQATDEATGEPTDEPTDQPSDEPTEEPTDEVAVTDEPTEELTDEPTLEPTEEPSPTVGPVPTAPPTTAFTIDSIDRETTVRQQTIDIAGAGPPGSSVTRDIPLWFDEHAFIGSNGRWTMRVGLSAGMNDLRFRLGDDRATEILLRITYQP